MKFALILMVVILVGDLSFNRGRLLDDLWGSVSHAGQAAGAYGASFGAGGDQ